MAYVAGPHTVIGNDVVDWVNDNEITGIAADDLALEVLPNRVPENTLSVHGSLLRDLGVYIGEIWWLEELTEDCAGDGRYEFSIAAQPLNIPGAVGSPLPHRDQVSVSIGVLNARDDRPRDLRKRSTVDSRGPHTGSAALTMDLRLWAAIIVAMGLALASACSKGATTVQDDQSPSTPARGSYPACTFA